MNSYKFTKVDIEKISNALNASWKEYPNHYRIEVKNKERKLSLYFEIYSEIEINNEPTSLISIYDPLTHLQLQRCTGYVISDLLG